ncbi:MAG: prolipoprotein diacylglyceryl transferase [Clostridia bacterium]|nr:prolipoprotein diacylglyceryl transferase [Clostridia bacterium]
MHWINDFLRAQPKGGILHYNLMGVIAIVVMVLTMLFYLVRMRVSLLHALKGVAIGAIAFVFTVYAQYLVVWYRVGFAPDRYFQESNLALGFTLLPLIAWLSAKTFNTSVGFAGDVTALAVLGYHVVGRSGCLFSGCCYGFACDWGLYSPHTGQNQFPICLVESGFTLAILTFLIFRICRRGYTPDGRNLPYFLLFYGVCRFCSETARESTKESWLFWRISDVHFHALAMAAVGGFLLWRIAHKERIAAVGEGSSPLLL